MFAKYLYAYKGFICKTLDPFFDSHALEFIDPDEDVLLLSESASDFEYDLPDGYDSHNEANPDCIPVVSSGSDYSSEFDLDGA